MYDNSMHLSSALPIYIYIYIVQLIFFLQKIEKKHNEILYPNT